MKGRTKAQKGITLIALIITIVVLLILAAVAISSIQNDGILQYAQNAADAWNKAAQNEANMLGDYLNYLNNMGSGSGSTEGEGSGDDEVAIVTPKVGQYVEYDVSYDDMYNSTSTATKTFGKTDGWRYLGTESGTGNHLLISTGVPMILSYSSSSNDASAQWWPKTQTKANARMAEGLKKKLANIPYTKVSAGTTSATDANTIIGLFGDGNKTTVGDYFKVTEKTYSDEITVRTLTLEELKAANGGTQSGFKHLKDDALGLFDLSDIGLSNNYYYWLASPYANDTSRVYVVEYDDSEVTGNLGTGVSGSSRGLRPVVVLPSRIQFTNVDNNSVLEIKE